MAYDDGRLMSARTAVARLLLALLLMLGLLACPYSCRAGWCGCCAPSTVNRDSPESCPLGCCSHHDEPSDSEYPAPHLPGGSRTDSCICHGALANVDAPTLSLELHAAQVVEPVPAAEISPTSAREITNGARAHWLGDTGAELRRTCCSWLC